MVRAVGVIMGGSDDAGSDDEGSDDEGSDDELSELRLQIHDGWSLTRALDNLCRVSGAPNSPDFQKLFVKSGLVFEY
jgi:hypothetical protein